MNRKILSILMSVLLLVSSVGLAFASNDASGGFEDMPDNWSTSALEKAVSNGLLGGYVEDGKQLIKAGNSLTRAEMATIVNRAFAAEKKGSIASVADVATGAWYAGEMAKAVKMGTFMLDTRMRPDDGITRQEAFTVLARAFKLGGGDAKALDRFSDKGDIAGWAQDSLAGMAAAGYIQGSDGKLQPKANITRAEFATVMDNLVKQYIDSAEEVGEVADGNLVVRAPGVTLKGLTVKGDLIIADGVGEGDVTLDNVKVEGRMVVRGGGVDSIIIKGNSDVGRVIVAKVDGEVRIYVEGGAEVETVYVDDGSDDVIVEGRIAELELAGDNVIVTAKDATLGKAEISGDNSTIVVGSGSTLRDGTISGKKSTIVAEKGATVDKIVVSGPDASVEGEGTVKEVDVVAGGDGTIISTPGTDTYIEEGVEAVDVSGVTDEREPRPSRPSRPQTYTLTFNITVVDEDAPGEVIIEVKDGWEPDAATVEAETDGTYKLQPGEYVYIITKEGYEEIQGPVDLTKGDAKVEVTLVYVTVLTEKSDYAAGDILRFIIGGLEPNIDGIRIGMPIQKEGGGGPPWASGERVLSQLLESDGYILEEVVEENEITRRHWVGKTDDYGVLTAHGIIGPDLPYGTLRITLPDYGYHLESSIQLKYEHDDVYVGRLTEKKAAAQASIKPNWKVKSVTVAGDDLPEGVEEVNYKVTLETSYDDLEAAKASERSVTTYFSVPEGVTVWYPVWADGELKYKKATEDSVAFGMTGHPLSSDNIEADGVVYVSLGDADDTSFEFDITLVDGEWKDVVYGSDTLEVNIMDHFPVVNSTKGLWYATIQTAVDTAEAGDVILVTEGIYQEEVVIDRPIAIQGYDNTFKPLIKGNVTLASTASGTSNKKTILQNLSITPPEGASGTYDSLILQSANHIVIKDCDFDARGIFAQTGGLMFRGVQMNGSCKDVDIDGCTFRDGYYIALQGKADNLTIKDSVVTNCESGVNLQHGNLLLVLNTEMEIVAKSPDNNAYCIRFASTSGESGAVEIHGGSFILDKEYEGMPSSGKYASAIIIRKAAAGSHAIENAHIQGEVVDDSMKLNLEDVLGDNTFSHKAIIKSEDTTQRIVLAYTVTLDKNGQEDFVLEWDDFLVAEGDTLSNKTQPNYANPEDFLFQHWNTEADGSGLKSDEVAEVWDDMTLYAIWRPKYVASIGDKKYVLLTSAISKVHQGGTITLLADIDGGGLHFDVELDPNLTLDLNSHIYEITGKGVAGYGIKLDSEFSGKDVNVKIKNGTIKVTNDQLSGMIYNKGTLTLENVQLETSTLLENGPLYVPGKGTLYLKGDTEIKANTTNDRALYLKPSSGSHPWNQPPFIVDIANSAVITGKIEIDTIYVMEDKYNSQLGDYIFDEKVQIIVPARYIDEQIVNTPEGFEWVDYEDNRKILKRQS